MIPIAYVPKDFEGTRYNLGLRVDTLSILSIEKYVWIFSLQIFEENRMSL